MIFKRYSSPFIFLDNLLVSNSLNEVIDFVFKQTQEEKWWELYLATLPLNEKSYDAWKKEMQGATNNVASTMQIDAQQVIKKSQDILSGFKPPR